MDPKIIEVPGIPGKLQEMTLDQYLSALSADHLARKQLDEIRGQALKAVEFSSQLLAANQKIMELQNKLIFGAAGAPGAKVQETPDVPFSTKLVPPPGGTAASKTAPPELLTMGDTFAPSPSVSTSQNSEFPANPVPKGTTFPRAECPHCGKSVSTSPGAWSSHQRNAHPDNPAPRPTV